MEWRALVTALPRGPDGQRIAAVIQAASLEGTQPVRIAFGVRDLALIEAAAAQV